MVFKYRRWLTYGDVAVDVRAAGSRHTRTKLGVAQAAQRWRDTRDHKGEHHTGTWGKGNKETI